MSKIVLSEEREELIRDSFIGQEVHFSYPHDLDDFNYLVDNFTQEKSNNVDSELGENLKVNKLIVMDDVSGLADKSNEFSNFLTVSRKYGFSCLYVFHTIYPGRQNWEMIMSQTHIFNFFPSSIHSSRIMKTLSLFASRQRNTYLTKMFGSTNFTLKYRNLKKKSAWRLTLETLTILDLENLERLPTTEKNRRVILIKKVTPTLHPFLLDAHKLNQYDFLLLDQILAPILSIKASTSMWKVQCLIESLRANFNKLVQKTLTMEDPRIKNEEPTDYMTTLQSQPMYDSDNAVDYSEEIKQQQPEKSRDISQQQSSKIVNRHRIKYTVTRIKYSPTRIKSRNFLWNISYNGISKNDFYNENFILDVYVLLVKNLNPFSLSRKVLGKTKHEMVWRVCSRRFL